MCVCLGEVNTELFTNDSLMLKVDWEVALNQPHICNGSSETVGQPMEKLYESAYHNNIKAG